MSVVSTASSGDDATQIIPGMDITTLLKDCSPFIGPAIGAVSAILAARHQELENKLACESILRRILDPVKAFAMVPQAIGAEYKSGTPTAILMEPLIDQLCALRDDVLERSVRSSHSRVFGRDSLKAKLARREQEVDYAIEDYQGRLEVMLKIEADEWTADLGQDITPSDPAATPDETSADSSASSVITSERANDSVAIALMKHCFDSIATSIEEGSDLHDSIEMESSELIASIRALTGSTAKSSHRPNATRTANPTGAAEEKALDILRHLSRLDQVVIREWDLSQLKYLGSILVRLHLPAESVFVHQIAVTVHRRRASLSRATVGDKVDLGTSLLSLRGSLVLVGRFEEASACSNEAREIFQELSEDDPNRYRALMAKALYGQSEDDAQLGRQSESLAATEESLAIWRVLYKEDRATCAADLASTFNTYSIRLGEGGRLEESLGAAETCLQLRRTLYQKLPGRFADSLASALANYSKRLSAVGRSAEALSAAHEGLAMYRALHQNSPAGHILGLASALHSYSARLGEVGLWSQALAASDECVKLWRALYKSCPFTHAESLALALKGLYTNLAAVDRHAYALAACRQCVELYRDLYHDRPATHAQGLAGVLRDYSARLACTGVHDEALAASEESLNLYQELYTEQPTVFSDDMTRALCILATRLRSTGRRKEALTVTEDAVHLIRAMYTHRPATYGSQLASILLSYAAEIERAGRSEEALTATKESLDLRRQLYGEHPKAHALDIIATLNSYSYRLSAAGRHVEALRVSDEAIDIHRQLPRGHRQTREMTKTIRAAVLQNAIYSVEAAAVEARRCHSAEFTVD
ncbi:hypothetical protein V8E36_005196 [Tilletia maclaganii]